MCVPCFRCTAGVSCLARTGAARESNDRAAIPLAQAVARLRHGAVTAAAGGPACPRAGSVAAHVRTDRALHPLRARVVARLRRPVRAALRSSAMAASCSELRVALGAPRPLANPQNEQVSRLRRICAGRTVRSMVALGVRRVALFVGAAGLVFCGCGGGHGGDAAVAGGAGVSGSAGLSGNRNWRRSGSRRPRWRER